MLGESTRRTAFVAVLAVLLAAFVPFLALSGGADADGSGSDLSIYRMTPKLTVTTEDPANVEYIVWDFGDGTVLDGRWEYYIAQQNKGMSLSDEITAGIEAYKKLLDENCGSLWVTTHKYAATGTYTVTVVAINALGFVPEGGNAYDGVLYVDETGFDGGMFSESAKDITKPSDSDLTDSSFKSTAGSWCRVIYKVDVLGYPTITFDSMNGSAVDSVTVENGSEYAVASKPADPVREGFTFTGWFTDDGCTQPYDWSLKVEAPMTLYAGWTSTSAIEYDHRITFYDGETIIGEQNVRNETNGNVAASISQSNPSKDGYGFLGWSTVAGSSSIDYTFGSSVSIPVEGLQLYAVWQTIVGESVTVTVDGNSITFEKGKTVADITIPSKEGYAFDGWYSDEGLQNKVSDDTVLTDGMTLFSKYTEKTDAEDSIVPYVVCIIGILMLIVGIRSHPALIAIGALIAIVAGLDIAGILEVL